MLNRKLSSTLWLKRQLNDPYVQAAQRDGYRSRAAYKLIELNDKYQFLKKAKTIVDLGAAPGGWTQVAVEMAPQAQVLALDINEMDEINGAQVMQGDIYDPAIIKAIKEALNGPVDLVLSDMAPPSSGHRSTGHRLRRSRWCEPAVDDPAARGVPSPSRRRSGP